MLLDLETHFVIDFEIQGEAGPVEHPTADRLGEEFAGTRLDHS